MKKWNRVFVLGFLISLSGGIFAQNEMPAPAITHPPTYPVIVASMCVFFPIVSTTSKTTTWNFSNATSIGLATGINVLYSDKFGFSFDLAPVVTSTKGGTSKVSNFIFDPGPIFRLKKGLAIITRVAFETAGRFGESTVISKVFSPTKSISPILALGIPVRFGNNLPASIGATIFLGIGFK
jgi:hypothetical protein